MKLFKENNIWNKFISINIIICIISTGVLCVTGKPTKIDALIVTVLFYMLFLKMLNIFEVKNKKEEH